ncbi:MAG: Hpt domain-containing protein [Planctomycetota bacterium]
MTTENGIDWKKIKNLQKIGGDKLLKKLYILFLEKTPQQVDSFFQNYQIQNWRNIENTAHSLKSSTGNLGLTLLYSLSQTLESKAHQGIFSEILPLIQSFQSEFERIQPILQQELQKMPS